MRPHPILRHVAGLMSLALVCQVQAAPVWQTPPPPLVEITPDTRLSAATAPYVLGWRETHYFQVSPTITGLAGRDANGRSRMYFSDAKGTLLWTGFLMAEQRNVAADAARQFLSDTAFAKRLQEQADLTLFPERDRTQDRQVTSRQTPVFGQASLASLEGLPFIETGAGANTVYVLFDVSSPANVTVVKELLAGVSQDAAWRVRWLPLSKDVSYESATEAIALYAPTMAVSRLLSWSQGERAATPEMVMAGLPRFLRVTSRFPVQDMNDVVILTVKPGDGDGYLVRLHLHYPGLAVLKRDFTADN